MRILEELFTTISEFRKYAPYAESNVTFDQLNSSAISAKKQMVIILTLRYNIKNELFGHGKIGHSKTQGLLQFALSAVRSV